MDSAMPANGSVLFRAVICTSVCAILAAGCSQFVKRAQSPDGESLVFPANGPKTSYIGAVADPFGLQSQKVDAVGLITELNGTGSDPMASPQRDHLEAEIKTHQIPDINGLLAGRDTSMVVVRGFIPPAAQKGDRFDLELQVMPRSETKDLFGGFLMPARMKPMLQTKYSVEMGHDIALGEGRVITRSLFESDKDPHNQVSGVVIGGGVVTKPLDTGIILPVENKSIPIVTSMTRAINNRFSASGNPGVDYIATAKTDRAVLLVLPQKYSSNPGRFFNVVLNIAFDENSTDRINRLEKLERQLHDPATIEMASVRLEGMGEEAIPALKRGLRADRFATRFHSAEALAYLGDTSGVDILRDAVAEKSAYRWHGLKALETLGKAGSQDALLDLLDCPSFEARCGAFQSLCRAHPHMVSPLGERIGQEFDLFEVDTQEEPFVHVSMNERREIAVFGRGQTFASDWLYIEPGLTIKALDQKTVQIKQFLPYDDERTRTCSSRVRDVLRELGKLGYDYGDLLKILKDARETDALDCQLLVGAAPRLQQSYRYVDTPDELLMNPELGDLPPQRPRESEETTSTVSVTDQDKESQFLDQLVQ